jgi:hypothetical protein
MKKVYCLGILSALLSIAEAQVPVLTQANYPAVGDSYAGIVNNSATWDPGAAGANVTWDFSSIGSGINVPSNYVDPSTTPYAATFTSPGSNMASEQLSNYIFFNTSPTVYQITGTVTCFFCGMSPTIRPYSNPQKVVTFPFTYGNTFKDTAKSSYSGGGGNNYIRTIHSETLADGYGNVTVPGPATYNNVLRIRIVSEIIDSVFNGSWIRNDISIDTQYYWISEDHKPHVFSMSKTITEYGTASEATTILAQYFSNPAWPTATQNKYKTYVNVFPNPSVSHLTISMDAEKFNSGPEKIFYLTDQYGIDIEIKTLSSDNFSISRNHLPSGLYHYRITEGDKIIASGKIHFE